MTDPRLSRHLESRRRVTGGPSLPEAVVLASVLGLLCGGALGVMLADRVLPVPAACAEVAP